MNRDLLTPTWDDERIGGPIEWHLLDIGAPRIPVPSRCGDGAKRKCATLASIHGMQTVCLRPHGHTGRHAAYGASLVVAVWA